MRFQVFNVVVSLSVAFCHSRANMTTNNGHKFLPLDESFATRAIHAGQEPEQWTGNVVIPPIYLGTTFKQEAPGVHKGYEYGRSGNPSRAVLETCLASTEGAKYALTFASGLAATNGVFSLLSSGDHVVACDDVYGGTNRYVRKVAAKSGIEFTFVDTTNIVHLENAIKPNTKLIWLESPTNPLLKIMDIPAISKAVKAINKDIIIVVDNTFLTSYLQRPLALGADISAYSATKFINGHSDVIMGAIATNDDKIYQDLLFSQNSMGIVPSPFDCYLVNRSLKTLAIRMKQHMANAAVVAKFLESHSFVEKVIWPGLPSHPQHELAKRLWSGVSGVMSFYIKGGLPQSRAFLSGLKIFSLAESLGGFESLAELPSIMTHASVPEDQRKSLGITDGLIRLSVGLEDANDLMKDLDQALIEASKV